MADDTTTNTTDQLDDATTDAAATAKDAKGTPEADDSTLTDKHGERAVNRGRYDRDMKAKDAEIAELRKQLEEAGAKAKSGDEALKEVEKLKAQLADEKLDHQLQQAGCVNAKAAKALLDDYSGDVEKMKESCPYLFGQSQTGSTGAKPGGAPSSSEERRRKAREVAGLPTK